MIAFVAVLMLSPDEIAMTSAPFAAIYTKATGGNATIITIISIFAIINGALIQMIMVSRILYGMSKEKWLPYFLSYVHPKTQTPVTATVLVMAVILILALWFPLVSLANMTSSLILVIFTFVNLSLVKVKLRGPNPEGVKTVPIWVPVIGAVINIIFIVLQLVF